ncbi:MAG: hypothetical protein KKG59_04755 [Nanoarchaeota archaeon]|nr:hypothetical protein [Nanoarchaeota archaeon]
MAHIETGVDKLVNLVQKKQKVSVDEASKELGVSNVIIQEWADFLEEEGMISIEYSLSKVFLCEKKLSKREVEKKTKEYADKKDSFIRKVEVAMRNLDVETKNFEKIKIEFTKLKEGLGGEVEKIHDQLSEIRHFEDLKKNMDQEIQKQKEEYNDVLDETDKKISLEQKKYEDIISQIEKERQGINQEKNKMKEAENEEDILKQKLTALTKVIDVIDKKISEESNIIEKSEKQIDALEKMASKVEDELKKKKTDIVTPLIEMSHAHKEKIIKIQDDILEKIKSRKSDIEILSSEGKEAARKFENFFSKKSRIDKLFNEIESNKADLKTEMEELIKTARAFNVALSATDMKKHIQDLLKKYGDVEKKKVTMRDSMDNLVGLLKNQ